MNAPTHDWLPRHRLSVDDYYRMAETGVLAMDARVELIEGEIIDMPPIGSRHGGIVGFLTNRLTAAAGDAALVWSQLPLRLSRTSEPQPDLMLLRPREDYYTASHPCAADALLVVEVSESTLRYDRKIKGPLYARHGVVEFWLIDLGGKTLHIHKAPQEGAYSHTLSLRAPGMLPVSSLEGVQVDLTGMFELLK